MFPGVVAESGARNCNHRFLDQSGVRHSRWSLDFQNNNIILGVGGPSSENFHSYGSLLHCDLRGQRPMVSRLQLREVSHASVTLELSGGCQALGATHCFTEYINIIIRTHAHPTHIHILCSRYGAPPFRIGLTRLAYVSVAFGRPLGFLQQLHVLYVPIF